MPIDALNNHVRSRIFRKQGEILTNKIDGDHSEVDDFVFLAGGPADICFCIFSFNLHSHGSGCKVAFECHLVKIAIISIGNKNGSSIGIGLSASVKHSPKSQICGLPCENLGCRIQHSVDTEHEVKDQHF